MAKKKTLEDKIVEVANEIFEEETRIYSDNIKSDGTLPYNVEILTKDMEITKSHLEQLVFLLKKYKKKN